MLDEHAPRRVELGLSDGGEVTYVREDLHDDLVIQVSRLHAALEAIASPQRPDDSWNLDREACRQIATEALRHP